MTSFESYILAHQAATGPVKKGEAWNNIKLYYSAYFAANSIIRILGISCTYISGDVLSALRRAASAVTQPGGIPLKINQAVYRVDAFNSSNLTEFSDLKGTAHEAFWRCFASVITEADTKIDLAFGPARFANERAKLISIKNLLKPPQFSQNSSRGDWLSEIRNNINYRHEYGLWFPYKSNPPNNSSWSFSYSASFLISSNSSFGTGRCLVFMSIKYSCFVAAAS